MGGYIHTVHVPGRSCFRRLVLPLLRAAGQALFPSAASFPLPLFSARVRCVRFTHLARWASGATHTTVSPALTSHVSLQWLAYYSLPCVCVLFQVAWRIPASSVACFSGA